jgi:Mn2+/Fe2+ NRAMP family transporter
VLLFSLGIIGTGMLAVPVLAGYAAYAVAETFRWRRGLDRKLRGARGFHAIVALATFGGIALTFSPIDPIKALCWSALISGAISVPVLIVTMARGQRQGKWGNSCRAHGSSSSAGWPPR